MAPLRPILPCPFTARLLASLSQYYGTRGCELVLPPHVDAGREHAYVVVRTDSSLDLMRVPLSDTEPVLDVVSTSPVVLDSAEPTEIVSDAISEGAWG
jgi:hypothetical protein